MPKTPRKTKLSDIAARAKVSVPAVSMALADHPRISLRTKRRIWQISEELGYRVPRRTQDTAAPAAGASVRKIGFACLHGNFASPVNSAMMMQLATFASRVGVGMETFCIEEIADQKRNAQRVAAFAQSLDGVILTGWVSPQITEQLRAAGTPFVVMGDPLAGAQADHVTYDGVDAGLRLASHLLARGHRQIAFIVESKVPGSVNWHIHDGYVLAHFHAGITPDPALSAVIDDVIGHEVYHRTPEVMRRLLSQPQPPTAVVTPNPFIAEVLVSELAGHSPPIDLVTTVLDAPPPGLRGLPAVVLSLSAIAEQAFRRLLYLCRHPHGTPLRVIVPFDTVNME